MAIETAAADLPSDLRWLLDSGAVTIEQLARLHDSLGIITVADLVTALERDAVKQVAGLSAAVEAGIRKRLPTLRPDSARVPISRAVAATDPLLAWLRARPDVDWAEPVGSLRRGHEMIGDVELLVQTGSGPRVIDDLAALNPHAPIRHRSENRLYFIIDRIQIGVRCERPASAAVALINLTGHRPHVAALRKLAASRGMSLDPDALRHAATGRVAASTETAIYDALDLPFIAPELRDDDGDAIADARNRRLPQLVERQGVLGDLHMHTSWSDGRDSIEDMVAAAAALGYQYVAITDHSRSSAAARSLSLDDVARQADEVAAARERHPEIAVLHGCEVEILPDGSLDFPDRVLKRFDIVLASLHDHANQPPDQLLRRYLRAMLHPLVSIITHPTNRLFPRRLGYALAFDRLFEAAAETLTLLEIDGGPTHLDLDASMARRAVGFGATLVIDSDAHRTDALDYQMRLGVMTARRGWIDKQHVLNTQPLREIRATVAAKRRGARR